MSGAPVVAAVIERAGRYLLGRRPAHKRHGGLWEFPGGKLDADEDAAEAATRELAEELELTVITVDAALHSVPDAPAAGNAPGSAHGAGSSVGEPAAPFVIHFHPVSVRGAPRALEHDEIGWFSLAELREMPLAPADRRFVAWLGSR